MIRVHVFQRVEGIKEGVKPDSAASTFKGSQDLEHSSCIDRAHHQVGERPFKPRHLQGFLTPMTGAPVSRSGRGLVTSNIQASVTAQRLRYLGLLFEGPWRASLARLPGIREEAGAIEVRLPHPGFFIVQKILISEEPNRHDKRPKDMGSIYQIVSLFRRELPALAEEVRARMGMIPAWRKWLARFRRLSGSLFSGPAAPGSELAPPSIKHASACLKVLRILYLSGCPPGPEE